MKVTQRNRESPNEKFLSILGFEPLPASTHILEVRRLSTLLQLVCAPQRERLLEISRQRRANYIYSERGNMSNH